MRRHLILLFSLAAGATALVAQPVEKVNWATGVSYAYDGSGNVAAIGNDEFVYDDVGRLVQAEVNGSKRNYTYDAFGNRKTCSHDPSTDCQYGFSISSTNNRISDATYDNGNPNGAGNVTTLRDHHYSYDALDMMTSDDAAQFIYTADDERIATYVSGAGSWVWTIRDFENKVLRQFVSRNGSSGFGKEGWTWTRDYVWRDGAMLASRQPEATATTTYHYHIDHLGTPRRITDDKDTVVGFHDYFAFGPETGNGKLEPARTDLKYTGHERDAQAAPYSLDYMHARYYNNSLGRFLSVDPVLDTGQAMASPQLWNRYQYALNAPLVFTDPTGAEVYIVTWGVGFRGEAEFKRAAETMAAEIKEWRFYDSKFDHIILKGVKTKADYAAVVALANALAPKYGKVQELHHYSHAGPNDGPEFRLAAGTGGESWTPDELKAMKINWGTDPSAKFYGCYTGKKFSTTFAQAQHVTTFGQPRFSYFSASPLERVPIGATGPVYLISAPGKRNPGPVGLSWVDYATGFRIRDPMVESRP